MNYGSLDTVLEIRDTKVPFCVSGKPVSTIRKSAIFWSNVILGILVFVKKGTNSEYGWNGGRLHVGVLNLVKIIGPISLHPVSLLFIITHVFIQRILRSHGVEMVS